MNFVFKSLVVIMLLGVIGAGTAYFFFFVNHSPIAAPVVTENISVRGIKTQADSFFTIKVDKTQQIAGLEATCEKHRSKLKDTLAQTRLVQAEVDDVDKEILKVTKKLKSLGGFLDTATTKMNNAKAEVAGTAGRLAQVQNRGRQFDSTLAKAQQDFERAKSHLIEAEAYHAEKLGKIEAAKVELATATKQRATLVSGGATSLQTLNTQTNALAEKIAEAEDQIDALEADDKK